MRRLRLSSFLDNGLQQLLGLTRPQLADWLTSVGASPRKAPTIIKALHQQGQVDFTDRSDLSLSLRSLLADHFMVSLPKILVDNLSNDGTRKWLLQFEDGNSVETVYIPEGERGTLCVSSQVGCALNCSFCATGKMGFNRNLTTAEIIAQVWIAARTQKISNIVFMGMGEPLLNLDNVIPAIDILLDDYAYNFSKYRVTVSTSGLLPGMRELAQKTEVSLAVSLHASYDSLRNELVPINKKYPISDLMSVCRDYYPTGSKRTILFEYVLLDGINDSDEDARILAELLREIPAKVNLIPFNPFKGTSYKRSTPERIDAFRAILTMAGLIAVTRKTRGEDIEAACGQLIGNFKDRTRRTLINNGTYSQNGSPQ